MIRRSQIQNDIIKISEKADTLYALAGWLEHKYHALYRSIPDGDRLDKMIHTTTDNLSLDDLTIPPELEGFDLMVALAKKYTLVCDQADRLAARRLRYIAPVVKIISKRGSLYLSWEEELRESLKRERRKIEELINSDKRKNKYRMPRLLERLKEIDLAIERDGETVKNSMLKLLNRDWAWRLNKCISLGDSVFELQKHARTGKRSVPGWLCEWEVQVQLELGLTHFSGCSNEQTTNNNCINYNNCNVVNSQKLRG